MTRNSVETTSRRSPDEAAPLRLWVGRVGSLALVGLGMAHVITNARGFSGGGLGSWLLFLVFAVGLSALLVAIAVVTWRHVGGRCSGWVARVIILLGAIFCVVTMFNVLRLHPEVILNPAGAGPWVLVGGPALLITALWPSRLNG